MSDLERNQQNVTSFYGLVFNQCRPREAIERYAGDRYLRHNPGVADDKGSSPVSRKPRLPRQSR